MQTSTALLGPGDEDRLERYLLTRPDTTMFLRSNLREGGIVDRGEPYQGTWVATLAEGEVLGVVTHGWNGILLFEADTAHVGDLAIEAARRSERAVTGLIGPCVQVEAARRALGLSEAGTTLDSVEDLFSLELTALVVPALLGAGGRVRAPRQDEVSLLVDWRLAYEAETIGWEVARENVEASMRRYIRQGIEFVLEVDGELVAGCHWNARTADAVQIGGVWTPPALRDRGYARAVVAGALQEAARQGLWRTILFTPKTNHAARRAYEALGYRIVGDYAIVLLDLEAGQG